VKSPSSGAAWTEDQDAKLQQLRREGRVWEDIGNRFNKSAIACRLPFMRLQAKAGTQPWAKEDEDKLKTAYQKRKTACGIWLHLKWDLKGTGERWRQRRSNWDSRD